MLQPVLARFHSDVLIAHLADARLEHDLQRTHDREVRSGQDALFHGFRRERSTHGDIASGIDYGTAFVRGNLELDALGPPR